MDRQLLDYYNRELQHVRESGAEFAREFPKIAGRLGLEGFECADPYVERLLEGFAFMAARIQLKIDAEYPRFTQHLIESVYPSYLAPVPSMTIVRFEPDTAEGSLAAGVVVPRGSALRGPIGKGEQTACEYRTAHDVTLWPIELVEAEYFRFSGAASSLGIPAIRGVKAGLRIRLRTFGGLRFDQLALDRIVIHLRGSEELPSRLYEQLLANCVAVVARPARLPAPWMEVRDASAMQRVGFEDHQALLPARPRAFGAHRLLSEYFALPNRFLFVELGDLGAAVRRHPEPQIDVIVLFDRSDPDLEGSVGPANLDLFCTPAVNLFPKRLDRIDLSERDHELHVVADRTRPNDYEIYEVLRATGHGSVTQGEQSFMPLYATTDRTPARNGGAYFSVRRTPRLKGIGSDPDGLRSQYLGTEVFLMLVDADEAPYAAGLKQLGIEALCTNRDLPLLLTLGQGRTDFTLAAGAPVRAVRALQQPTKPKPPLAAGRSAWRLISHLSLNYLSLLDDDERRGAASLRETLALYADTADEAVRKQVEGVRAMTARPILRRIPNPGPIAFGRGLEIDLTLDEASFRGTGVFVLGAVLERFFARFASINSFTETVIRTIDRGVLTRWPARKGQRPIL